jgi:hypothetical protein
MSDDALSGAALLAAANDAKAALDKGNPPAGSGEARFVSAMIARALAVSKRDAKMAAEIAAAEAVLARAFGTGEWAGFIAGIRQGRWDADEALYKMLKRLAVLRLKATRPEALPPSDRR